MITLSLISTQEDDGPDTPAEYETIEADGTPIQIHLNPFATLVDKLT
jgi:hypothetical protein